MNQPNRTNGGMTQTQKRFIQESALLEPGIARRIGVGAYNKSEPEPEFTLTFEPENMREDVRIAFDKMDIPGTGRALYFCILLNSSDKRCRVTVALRDGEKK